LPYSLLLARWLALSSKTAAKRHLTNSRNRV